VMDVRVIRTSATGSSAYAGVGPTAVASPAVTRAIRVRRARTALLPRDLTPQS
jgi:hypothetical protein